MAFMYVVIWGFALACGLTAVYGLTWAIRSGQMRRFGEGATSIFDDEEPVGEMTDAFPGSARSELHRERERVGVPAADRGGER